MFDSVQFRGGTGHQTRAVTCKAVGRSLCPEEEMPATRRTCHTGISMWHRISKGWPIRAE